MRIVWLIPALLAAAACSGNASTADNTPSYQSIAGSYAGTMSGTSQGYALDANFGLTFTQSDGAISGSYALQGTVSDGFTVTDIGGTGPLTGTIASGSNPSVNLTITVPGCPNYSAHFSGAYDSANHRLTITGPVDLIDDACVVELSYRATLILNQ